MKTKTLLLIIISTIIVLTSGCSADVAPSEISSEIAIPTNTSTTTMTTVVSTTAATIISTTTSASGKECDITMYASVETNIRTQPNNKSKVVERLNVGDTVNVIFMYDNGWYEIYDEGNTYYILGDNLSLEKPLKETSSTAIPTTVPTTVATTTTTTVPTTVATTTPQTLKDNSDEIFEYKKLIADLESKNEQYQVEIILYEGAINEYNDLIDALNEELTSAIDELARIESQKNVRVYNAETGNFDWMADPKAVKSAQDYVDQINSLINECKNGIENCQSILSQYEELINNNNQKIKEYNKIIISLS